MENGLGKVQLQYLFAGVQLERDREGLGKSNLFNIKTCVPPDEK